MILLIDGNNLAHRMAHVGATLTGFVNQLLKMVYKYKPDEIFVAWDDPKRDYWRMDIYPDYKGNREGNKEIYEDIKLVKRFLRDAKISQHWEARQEADDLLATYARIFYGNFVIICSMDKDVLQLVSPRCKVLWGNKLFDAPAVFDKFGVRVSQLRDYLALIGDQSDNIPGVSGIGKKRAIKLLKEFGDAATITTNLKWLPDEEKLLPRLTNKKLKELFEDVNLDLMLQLVTLNDRCFSNPGGGIYEIADIKSTMRYYRGHLL